LATNAICIAQSKGFCSISAPEKSGVSVEALKVRFYCEVVIEINELYKFAVSSWVVARQKDFIKSTFAEHFTGSKPE